MSDHAPARRFADRYVVEELLGESATALVFRAHDERDGRTVALKCLRPGAAAATPALAGSLRAAAALARRLTHPGIVRVHDAGGDGDDEFLVMALVEGDTLAGLRGAPWRAIAAAAVTVSEALQFAHAVGVVHGDVKAANVLRDRGGRVFVTDFAATPVRSPSNASPARLDGAAPAIADDLYGLGTLLFDLLSGAPPFHPDITPARIRAEVPPRLAVDGTGEALPAGLAQLVAALLEKDPVRRPAGMGAVRAILDDLLAAPGRAGIARPAADQAPRATPVRPASRPRPGFVYAGLVVLAALTVAVLFVLPGVVRERGPFLTAPATLPAAPGPAAAAPAADGRPAADQARAAYLAELAAATTAGLPRFRPGVLSAAAARVAAGDTEYQARRFSAAAAAYAAATGDILAVRNAVPALLAATLQAGAVALAAGDAARAVAAYTEARAIDPANAAAARGLERAGQLPKVLAAMADGQARENAGDLAAARSAYARAQDLDRDWAPAGAALARLAAGAAAAEYQTAMAAGLAAAGAGREADARAAFSRALQLRPGDAAAQAGLADLGRAAASRALGGLLAEARSLAAAERWSEAVARYDALLQQDPSLAPAQSGRDEARGRASLDQRLRAALLATDRLNEAARAAAAAQLLAEARAVAAPGPVLAEQVATLAGALATAARPVPVAFESDNLTQVTIFKVGELGAFATRTVALKPGLYTVVGRRDGYRDVRRQIRVAAEGVAAPVVVRCEESI